MARHYLREDFSLPSSQWQTPYGVFSAEGVLVGYVLVLEQERSPRSASFSATPIISRTASCTCL